MDFSKFDEFGNPVDSGSSESEQSESEETGSTSSNSDEPEYDVSIPGEQNYYPLASEVFPEYTKVKHEGEDRQDRREPLIKQERARVIAKDAKGEVATIFDKTFLRDLFMNRESIRNIAFVGALGHGKTELIDVFVKETHPTVIEQFVTSRDITNQVLGEGRRMDRLAWTDRLFLEKRRMISISTEVMSLIGEDLNGKSWALNLIDTPGHPDFLDQVIVGLSMADGVVFCVDVIEGLTEVGRRLLDEVIARKLEMVLMLTKLDRLILELKLPPDVAHTRMRKVIEEINTCLHQSRYGHRLSPELFNVGFTSAQFSLCFTAESLGLMYNRKPVTKYKMDRDFTISMQSTAPDSRGFGARLWGDYRFVPEKRQIVTSAASDLPHPFVVFALEPLYKVVTHVLSYEPWEWSKLLRIPLTSEQMKMNTIPLLRVALSRVFGNTGSLVSMFTQVLPPPVEYSRNNSCRVAALVAKFVPSCDGEEIYGLVRVFKGSLHKGMPLYALGNDFEDNRESFVENISINEMAISHVRYSTPVDVAGPGMIVKVSVPVSGICTLTDVLEPSLARVRVPPAYLKVAIEPLDHSKNPELVKSISKARLCYPSLVVHADPDRGEQALFGTGEIFMDCVMHDIRNTFASIEVKVSDPFVVFNETVKTRSVTICHGISDDDFSLGVIAEPMQPQVQYDLENGNLCDKQRLPELLVKLGWDEMAADNVWTFGPDEQTGPNILVDDTLPPKCPQLASLRSVIEKSFCWACRLGPMCDEMMRGVVFRIVDVKINESKPLLAANVIPAVRKAIFSAFLASNPGIVEPIYMVEVMTPHQGIQICEDVVRKRRGKVLSCTPIHGTPLFSMRAEVPLIDMFGMEVDMRRRTAGLAFPLSFFHRWDLVPGDPLDSSAILKPLEPSPDFALSRDFVVKTRRRKGLSDDIDMSQYFESDELIEVAALLA